MSPFALLLAQQDGEFQIGSWNGRSAIGSFQSNQRGKLKYMRNAMARVDTFFVQELKASAEEVQRELWREVRAGWQLYFSVQNNTNAGGLAIFVNPRVRTQHWRVCSPLSKRGVEA